MTTRTPAAPYVIPFQASSLHMSRRSWPSGGSATTGFEPVKCLESMFLRPQSPSPPLRNHPPLSGTHCQAIREWQQVWCDDPRQSPVCCDLQPPNSKPLDFIQGIPESSRPVLCTAIHLLTEHYFTGEYSARHRPRAPGPHKCQCGATPSRPPPLPSHNVLYSRQPASAT
jgi:hypothetical protein